jgi:hypothetical protein
MSEDLTNLGNPVNERHDEEERNQPHVTSVPAEASADDLFDDTVEPAPETPFEKPRPDCQQRPPQNPVE